MSDADSKRVRMRKLVLKWNSLVNTGDVHKIEICCVEVSGNTCACHRPPRVSLDPVQPRGTAKKGFDCSEWAALIFFAMRWPSQLEAQLSHFSAPSRGPLRLLLE